MESDSNNLPPKFNDAIDIASSKLEKHLGENLHSLVLYGSSVRGGIDPESSNVNLLIILNVSTAHAHKAIRESLKSKVPIEPFVVELGGMHRATRVFALKFLSIRRDYRVLKGVDPLQDLAVSQDLRVLLTEQELRNLRMRFVRSYITAGPAHRRYHELLIHQSSRILIVLSDCLRCIDADIPHNLPDRIPVFEKLFEIDVSILRDLLRVKQSHEVLNENAAFEFHSRLVKLFSGVLNWMEKQWPELPL